MIYAQKPKFIPKPGQVDYTGIRHAPTVSIVVTFQGKIFCVQRSANMRIYPNQWDWICGYLDDDKSIEEKTNEELCISYKDVESLDLIPGSLKTAARFFPELEGFSHSIHQQITDEPDRNISG